MEMPEFPQEFVRKHCIKVMEARDWRKHYNLPPDAKEDEAHAECGFNVSGMGLQCENCRQYVHPASKMNPSPLDRPVDQFYGEIKKYYDDMEKYDKYTKSDEYKRLKRIEEAEATARRNIGAFI